MSHQESITKLCIEANEAVGRALARLPAMALAVTLAASRYERAAGDASRRTYWKAYEAAEDALVRSKIL